ncbi:MAG: ABC transporter substrate-binding protein [Actinomycetota bacterium]|nr:ABC transporter substrate-binding protein [Actinomycetota bacterium]
MEHVRLMTWCRSCVSGVHLPAFAAAEGGLFTEQGLEVEFVGCARAPDWTLRGFAARPKAVASGEAEFALTSVAYALAAQTELDGGLGARFAAVSHQRNPIAAIVRDDSGFERPADLQGLRAARWSMPWFAQEYAGALSSMGFDPSVMVDSPHPDAQLECGEIDVIPTWVDMTLNHVDRGYPVRPIALDIETYAAGLLAADRLPLELVTRMREAFVAGYELQLERPELGIAAFRRRFPDISEQHIRDSWSLFEPCAFDGGAPGAMDADRWETTIAHTAATHGLSAFPPERVYRPELLASTVEYALA